MRPAGIPRYGLGGGAVGIVDAFGRPAGGAKPEASPPASSGSGGFADFGAFPAFGDNGTCSTVRGSSDIDCDLTCTRRRRSGES